MAKQQKSKKARTLKKEAKFAGIHPLFGHTSHLNGEDRWLKSKKYRKNSEKYQSLKEL